MPPSNLILQNSYGFEQFRMLPGSFMAAFNAREVSNKIARGLLGAGKMAFKVPTVGGAGSRNSIDPGEAFQYVVGGTAADADAVLSGGASSASEQEITTFNGALAGGPFQPARAITLTLSNNADWNATTAVLSGINHLGVPVSENLSIPDSGNTALTSANTYREITSLVIPAQAGTGGTFTVGVAAVASGALTAADFFGVVVRQPVKTTINTSNLYGYPGQNGPASMNFDYADGETVPCLYKGDIAVVTETAVVDRGAVYCRVAASANGTELGAFRADDDGGSAVLVPNARFVRDAAEAGVAWCRFYGI
jgi:hypothetical protein